MVLCFAARIWNPVKADEKFQDTHVALFLMKNGKREWLRIRGRGVHHYYIQTLWKFVQKRRRATVHFLQVQEEMPVNWMKEKPPVPLWLAAVYCVTFFGPLCHTLRGILRDGDACWLWHLPACPVACWAMRGACGPINFVARTTA